MPSDPRKRQKKLERREAKRKAKRHDLVREKQVGLAERLTAVADRPVLFSWATTDLWDMGLGWVCLSRQLAGGSVAFALFLIDRYCLGVKNAMCDIVSRGTYDSRIENRTRADYVVKDLSPADVRKIVEGAVAYAESIGFHPHPDYQAAQTLFGNINAAESTLELEFGKDGKPFFVNGPMDTPERCRQIMRTLERSCGPGGYHLMLGGPVTPLEEDEEFDQVEWDGEEELPE
jgi:hypothetical protein